MPEWTAEQERAIELKDRRLLVSAAAGSGKTAVLTERICRKVTDRREADIDELLVMTFTKAAAGEMRERIRKRLEQETVKETAADPMGERASSLKKQLMLLDGARISTIDSFCLSVLREHSDLSGLDPAFRVGSEEELSLLRSDVMEEILEEAYEAADPEFLKFAGSFSQGKTDLGIPELLLSMYRAAESRPWPEEWLESCAAAAERAAAPEDDPDSLPWIKYLLEEMRSYTGALMEKMREALELCEAEDGPAGYRDAVAEEYAKAGRLSEARTFEELVKGLQAFSTWTTLGKKHPKEMDPAKKERAADLRKFWKTKIQKTLLPSFGAFDREMLKQDLAAEAGTIRTVVSLTLSFMERFSEKKRARNLLDFSDLEHFALKMLWEKQPDGMRVPTPLAEEYASQLKEIYVDEYQDSNEVQEQLLLAISHGDLFLVGDVKQSIYGFRQAKPALFLEKYSAYEKDHPDADPVPERTDTRVDLTRNFRSRPQVLDSANDIFTALMDVPVGGLRYTEEEALYCGASYPETGDGEKDYRTELLLTDAMGMTGTEKCGVEARLIAERIRELTDPLHGLKIKDGDSGQLRPARYGDIVILLRSMKNRAETMVSVLMSEGIPAEAEQNTGYFNALEVRTVLSILSAVDNPLRDIPAAAVLRSPVCGMTEEELAELLAEEREYRPLWLRLRDAAERRPECPGAEKFLRAEKMLEEYREKAVYLSLPELIRAVLYETGYYALASAMPGGEVRRANLDMLVVKAEDFERTGYRGLYDFIRYIELLKKYDTDFGEAGTGAAHGNAVRIMTIHKSKGLEFPVVILADMGHKFNQRDAIGGIVLDQKYGIAADVADPELHVKGSTLKKNVLSWHLRSETLGEELRVLYVAMTRAKEKLIMTAAVEQPDDAVIPAPDSGGRAGADQVRAAGSYLDWVLLAMSVSPRQCRIGLRVMPVEGIEQKESGNLGKVLELRKDLYRLLREPDTADHPCFRLLKKAYPHAEDINLHTKRSVSELKVRGQMEDEEQAVIREFEALPPEERKKAGAERAEASRRGMLRGTVYHRVMELLDYGTLSSREDMERQILELRERGVLTEEEADMISLRDFLPFLSDPLFLRMKRAAEQGVLRREAQFVMSLPAREVDPGTASEEPVLIQGIIDAWFEEDGKMVLVDYKTDRGITGEQLADRYRIQIEYYDRALRMMEGKVTGERILWSFALGKSINL